MGSKPGRQAMTVKTLLNAMGAGGRVTQRVKEIGFFSVSIFICP